MFIIRFPNVHPLSNLFGFSFSKFVHRQTSFWIQFLKVHLTFSRYQLSSIVSYFQISFYFFKKIKRFMKDTIWKKLTFFHKDSIIKRVNHKESTFKKPLYLKLTDFGKLSLDLSLVHLHSPFPHLLLVTSRIKVPQVAQYQANKHGVCHTVALSFTLKSILRKK